MRETRTPLFTNLFGLAAAGMKGILEIQTGWKEIQKKDWSDLEQTHLHLYHHQAWLAKLKPAEGPSLQLRPKHWRQQPDLIPEMRLAETCSV